MADIPQELATLLGRPCAVSIRRTDERPPRLSAIDVSVLVTNKDARKTAQDIGYVKERFPEVAQNLGLYKFPGRRQRETPVVNVRGASAEELCPRVQHDGAGAQEEETPGGGQGRGLR